MKKHLLTAFTFALALNLGAQSITFNEKELYPEGIAYNKKDKSFFVSSLHYGKIGKVDAKGKYTVFVDDADLISAIGIHADEARNLLYVASSDPGVSVKTNANTQRKHAKLAAYDMTTGKRKFIADLGAVNSDSLNFANDMAFDKEGNIYVTNSFSPLIFKVTQQGKVSVFTSDMRWKGQGFNLNGIVCINDFLIVNQSGTGKLFKISLKNSSDISVINAEAIVGADGMFTNGDNELIVISNSQKKIVKLQSKDNWVSADTKGETNSKDSFPTTGTMANGKYYILNAKLNELFAGGSLTSDFTIQELKF